MEMASLFDAMKDCSAKLSEVYAGQASAVKSHWDFLKYYKEELDSLKSVRVIANLVL